MSMGLYKRKKPVVGETYFIASNYYYKTSDEEGFIVTVTNVGKKYFTVKAENAYIEYKFDKNTFIHNNGGYTPQFNIYNSKEDYEKNIKAIQYKNEMINSLLNYLTWNEIITLHDRLIERRDNRTTEVKNIFE